jgi:phage-related holin
MLSDWEVVKHFFERLFECPAIKVLTGFFIWLIRLLFGSVVRPAYAAVAVLWLFDTATGYYHAWKNPKVIPESRRMYHGCVKLLVYFGLLMVGYQLGQTKYEVAVLIETVIEIAIMLTEGKSIVENLKKIAELKGKKIPVLDMVENLLQGKLNELEGENHDQANLPSNDGNGMANSEKQEH